MKNKFVSILICLVFLVSCSKTPSELFESSNTNLENDNIDLAIESLDKLVNNYPNDSLASI